MQKHKIKYIPFSETLKIRQKVLWPFLTLPECKKDWDSISGIYHLGVYSNFEVVCVGSFVKESHPELINYLDLLNENGREQKDRMKNSNQEQKIFYPMRLRAMATLPEFQKQGCGRSLLSFAFQELGKQGCNLLWCDAREKAFPFYESLGFDYFGDYFEIPKIGIHKVMWRKISVLI